MALSTQWYRGGMDGIPTGINYASLPVVSQMLAVAMTPALFADLQMMEQAALSAWARVGAKS